MHVCLEMTGEDQVLGIQRAPNSLEKQRMCLCECAICSNNIVTQLLKKKKKKSLTFLKVPNVVIQYMMVHGLERMQQL